LLIKQLDKKLTNLIGFAGNNGTIDGQGKMWWELWWNRTLEHTRGHLVELMNSQDILISNLTFRNSPFWTIHPIYCRLLTPSAFIYCLVSASLVL
jgi:polygalacturonase